MLTTTDLAELRALLDDTLNRGGSTMGRFEKEIRPHLRELLDAAESLAAIYALDVVALGPERYALQVAHVLDELMAKGTL
jgi:hypothetical protein